MFFPALVLLLLFEIAGTYFIMPLPGSQRWNMAEFSHFLYSWRWPIRVVLYLLLIPGLIPAFRRRKIVVGISLIALGTVTWVFHFPMTASNMFRPLKAKVFADAEANKINLEKLVLGVEIEGEARAYPVEMIGYHHRVSDTVGGKSIFVTYCTVCRTGRVYEPIVNKKQETFRLVGMDQFNAMFEDKSTGSWWRQANGEACAGKLKGQVLPSVSFVQMTLRQWLVIHPRGKVLQWDSDFLDKYQRMQKFDRGNSGSKLTGTDTGSWKEKSWVLGIQGKNSAHVYDWNWVKREDVVFDTIDNRQIVFWVSKDELSYYSYYLPVFDGNYDITKRPHQRRGDTISVDIYQIRPNGEYSFLNAFNASVTQMEPAPVYQEFWHSWRTFHPNSIQYPKKNE